LFEEFVGNLEIPKLKNTVRDELEGEVILEECQDILCTFEREKSQGDDGFAWEFYHCFFDFLRCDLIDSFYSAYNRGEMRISQRRGVINNWHPITLNLDHKSVSKVIATKIERVLPHLVCQDQSGFEREDIWVKTFDLLKIFWNKQEYRISQVPSCK